MHYNVGRNGQQLGQFSEQEIRAGLFEGRYQPTDLGWTEGMTDWKPLSELFGALQASGPAKPFPTFDPANLPQSSVYDRPGSSGMAIAALTLGIVSLLTCGLLGMGSVAAIVCGHIALGRIRMSSGAVGGRGMAMAGLIMGYFSLVLIVLFVLASLALPTFAKIQEKGLQTKSISNARQIVAFCNIYSIAHGGRFPDSLEELVEAKFISTPEILQDPLSPLESYTYFGAGMDDNTPADAVVLMSGQARGGNGKTVVARKNGAVTLEVPPVAQ